MLEWGVVMNHQQNSLRLTFFRGLFWLAVVIFIFDFNFYRYGIDVRLGGFMHGVVAKIEREADQQFNQWASL